MTDKEQALDLISKLPDTASLDDIMEELFFRRKVDRGLDDLQRGKVVSHDEARRRLTRWLQN